MRYLLLLLTLIISCNVLGKDIDKSTSGAWYNPPQAGHGFSIEVLPDGRMLLYWYVYNPDGTPTFLFASGQVTGNRVEATVYHHTGMPFGSFDNSDLVQTVWGTMTFTLHDCSSATLDYSSTMSHEGVPFGSGSIPLIRLSWIDSTKCTEDTLQANYHLSVVNNFEFGFGTAVFFGNGDLVYFGIDIFDADVVIGTWQHQGGNQFTFSATSYSLFGGSEDITGQGIISVDGFEATTSDGVDLTATKLPSFQLDLSYTDLAGTFAIFDLDFFHIGNITITNNGQISGSTFDGCSVSGALNIPDQIFSQATIEVVSSDCVESGTITGAISYGPDDDSLLVMGADGLTGFIFLLER